VVGIPGHHPASIAVHDERTGVLLTGDSVYPGRIYVEDPRALVDSMDRLVELTQQLDVSHVLGCHIEMTRVPRRDYPLGCRYQPDEPPLQMSVRQLRALRDAAASVVHRPGVHRHDDFVLCIGTGLRTQLPVVARGLAGRVRDAVRR
jgi:hypothetical protein